MEENNENYEKCVDLLKKLTGKEYILFVRRGNLAIEFILNLVKKDMNKELCLIQDQGGWMTYEKSAKDAGFNVLSLKTNYGLLNPDDIEKFHDSVLLINSMPAYSFLEDMNSIRLACDHNEVYIINDVSGSIGRNEAMIGDIVFSSFGKWKPIDLGEGGFIATDDKEKYFFLLNENAFTFGNEFYEKLYDKLRFLPKRLNMLNEKRKEVIGKLKKHNLDIIYPDFYGINIIVRFSSEEEKKKIEIFCDKEGLEYTICPRYIRVNEDAVSIEIKRLD